MKHALLTAAFLPHLTMAEEKTATVSWYSETTEIGGDKEIRTVVAMNVAKGWHTYWENPGEGGMPPEIKAALPDGWKIGDLGFPVPIRFMTGELPGFGYEGTVLFPLTLTPPAGFQGKAPELKATFSWLACNDDACLPGEAELTLTPSHQPQDIADAYASLPKAWPGAVLSVKKEEQTLVMHLNLPGGIDGSAFMLFPATRNILDPGEKPVLTKDGERWVARAKCSEYLKEAPAEFSIVLASPTLGNWRIATTKP